MASIDAVPCFVDEDPSGRLPEACGCLVTVSGLLVQDGRGQTLVTFNWNVLTGVAGEVSDDAGEMDLFRFTDVSAGDDHHTYSMQCESSAALVSSCKEKIAAAKRAVSRRKSSAVGLRKLNDTAGRAYMSAVSPLPPTIKELQDITLLCYTWDDPSGQLPEELGLIPDKSGLKVIDEIDGSVVTEFLWRLIVQYEGSVGEEPDDMDIFTFHVEGSGRFSVECDSAVPFVKTFELFKSQDNSTQDKKEDLARKFLSKKSAEDADSDSGRDPAFCQVNKDKSQPTRTLQCWQAPTSANTTVTARAEHARKHFERVVSKGTLVVWGKREKRKKQPIPSRLFPTEKFREEAIIELPKTVEVDAARQEDQRGECFHIILTFSKRIQEKWEPIKKFRMLKDQLAEEDARRSINFPPSGDKKKDAISMDRRRRVLDDWLEDLVDKARSSKLQLDSTAHLIEFLHSDASLPGEDFSITVQHSKLKTIQSKRTSAFKKTQEILRKVHALCKKNEEADEPEMPSDDEEIPGDSGHVYSNTEPTNSLRKYRKKVIAQNKDMMKLLDQSNKIHVAIHQSQGGHQRADIEAMRRVREREHAREDAKCMICFNYFKRKQELRVLPCGHHFHAEKCLDPWLFRGKNHCPSCLACILVINSDDEDENDDDDDGDEDDSD